MEIIRPLAEIWKPTNPVQHVARCARVCYGKDSPIGRENADSKLIKLLKEKGHLSMFRHETHYFIVPQDNTWLYRFYEKAKFDKISNWIGIDIMNANYRMYIVINGQYMLEHAFEDHVKLISDYEVPEYEFTKDLISCNMIRRTVHITTQISTSRELNRVSPNNISEKSTRYVYENGILCCPHWMTGDTEYSEKIFDTYINSARESFVVYQKCIENGMKREDARGILPLDTATECVYTYNLDEWKHIIDLRYYGKTGVPHPNAKIIVGMIREKLNKDLKNLDIEL